MYPQDQNNPLPVNYLDQISPQNNQPVGLFSKPILIALGVLIVSILLVGFMLLGSAPKDTFEKLAARLTFTSETVEYATGYIKDSNLRAANTNLTLYLENNMRDIEEVLTLNNKSLSKLDKNILAEESDSTVQERLEDARLNGIFDRVYAREMAYQLELILSLARQMSKSATKETITDYMSDTITNLEPIQQEFSDFNNA